LRLAVVNLTAGGLSGGYQKYLQHLLPLLVRDTRLEQVDVFLPPQAGRSRGLVVGVAAGAGDPSLATARWIATTGRERLLVLTPSGSEIASAGENGPRIFKGGSAQDVVAALGDTRERLIVMMRKAGIDLGAELSAARGVPVLELEPEPAI